MKRLLFFLIGLFTSFLSLAQLTTLENVLANSKQFHRVSSQKNEGYLVWWLADDKKVHILRIDHKGEIAGEYIKQLNNESKEISHSMYDDNELELIIRNNLFGSEGTIVRIGKDLKEHAVIEYGKNEYKKFADFIKAADPNNCIPRYAPGLPIGKSTFSQDLYQNIVSFSDYGKVYKGDLWDLRRENGKWFISYYKRTGQIPFYTYKREWKTDISIMDNIIVGDFLFLDGEKIYVWLQSGDKEETKDNFYSIDKQSGSIVYNVSYPPGNNLRCNYAVFDTVNKQVVIAGNGLGKEKPWDNEPVTTGYFISAISKNGSFSDLSVHEYPDHKQSEPAVGKWKMDYKRLVFQGLDRNSKGELITSGSYEVRRYKNVDPKVNATSNPYSTLGVFTLKLSDKLLANEFNFVLSPIMDNKYHPYYGTYKDFMILNDQAYILYLFNKNFLINISPSNNTHKELDAGDNLQYLLAKGKLIQLERDKKKQFSIKTIPFK